MPLQDRPDYQEWIARRLEREAELRDGERGKEFTRCEGCGIAAAERQLIGRSCIECLAFDFGGAYTHARIAESIRGVIAALGSPESARALVMHSLDRMDGLLSDVEHHRDAT